MGLDVSHGAFSGPYSAFNRFRWAVMKAIGGSWPPHTDQSLDGGLMYFPEDVPEETIPGLYRFFTIDDCEGEIDPETCTKLANEMELLVLPNLGKVAPKCDAIESMCKEWIEGCKAAAEAGEPLVFY